MSQDKLTRIAIVSNDKCKPKKCRQECRKSCPVVRMGETSFLVLPRGKTEFLCVDSSRSRKICAPVKSLRLFLSGKLCIEVSPADKIAFISEDLCIGCGICAKVNAIGTRQIDVRPVFSLLNHFFTLCPCDSAL